MSKGNMGMSKHRKSGKTTIPQHVKVSINQEYIKEQERLRKLKEARKGKFFSKVRDLFR